MASDEDFRRVAEDVRALARSLGRDVRQAAKEARQHGDWKGQQVRDELRGVADQARRNWGSRPQHNHDGTCWDWRGGRRRWAPPAPPIDRTADDAGGAVHPDGGWGAWPPGGRHRGWSPPPGPRRADGHARGGPALQPMVARSRAPRRTREPLPPLRHQRDGTLLLAVLIVGVGVLGALVATHALALSLEMVAAGLLMAVGATMVLTARTDWSLSRRSWPVWVGLGLVAVLVTTSSSFGVPQATRDLSVGSVNEVFRTGQSPPALIRGGIGDVTVDLRSADLKTTHALRVVNLAGDVTILLPKDPNFAIDARVTAGTVCLPGQPQQSGPNTHILATTNNATMPAFQLSVRDGAGNIRINQAGVCG